MEIDERIAQVDVVSARSNSGGSLRQR